MSGEWEFFCLLQSSMVFPSPSVTFTSPSSCSSPLSSNVTALSGYGSSWSWVSGFATDLLGSSLFPVSGSESTFTVPSLRFCSSLSWSDLLGWGFGSGFFSGSGFSGSGFLGGSGLLGCSTFFGSGFLIGFGLFGTFGSSTISSLSSLSLSGVEGC